MRSLPGKIRTPQLHVCKAAMLRINPEKSVMIQCCAKSFNDFASCSTAGIFWVLRSGAPWRDLPVCYGPRTTCYNRFVRWRKAGVWDRIMDLLAAAHDATVRDD